MIRSRATAFCRWCFTLTLPLIIVAVCVTADAQAPAPTAPPAPAGPLGAVPDTVKKDTNAVANRATIEQFITQAVAQLASENADAHTKARQALINGAFVPGARGENLASPAYL